MRAGTFFCAAHQANATEFCLCGKNPVYLCVTCLPMHADKSSHDGYPMKYLELFEALGNDKAELKRRIETVKHCSDFVDSASAREAAVVTEANNLITGLVQCYQGWLEKNHRCFNTLVEILREEVSLLLTASQVALSPLAQTLVERSLSLTAQEENLFCSIPEENALKELTQHCKTAIAVKAPRLQQSEYEEEVQQAFSKLPPPIQQVSAQGDVRKLIAVLQGQAQCFDVDTSQWQQLCALRSNINVDHCTSPTLKQRVNAITPPKRFPMKVTLGASKADDVYCYFLIVRWKTRSPEEAKYVQIVSKAGAIKPREVVLSRDVELIPFDAILPTEIDLREGGVSLLKQPMRLTEDDIDAIQQPVEWMYNREAFNLKQQVAIQYLMTHQQITSRVIENIEGLIESIPDLTPGYYLTLLR